jgi:hypothetical protein
MAPLTPTRATAIASALSDYRGWMLYPHCARCRVLRQMPVNELAHQVGSGTLFRDLLARLHCHRCGDPRSVKLSDNGRPIREVYAERAVTEA